MLEKSFFLNFLCSWLSGFTVNPLPLHSSPPPCLPVLQKHGRQVICILGSKIVIEAIGIFQVVLLGFENEAMDFRTGKPVNMAPDWTGHVTSSANQCTRIPVRNPYCLLARQ